LYLDIDKNKVKTDILAGNDVKIPLAGGGSLDSLKLTFNYSGGIQIQTDTNKYLGYFEGELVDNNIVYDGKQIKECLDNNNENNIVITIYFSHNVQYTDESTYNFTNRETITLPTTY
jgi:hypothetical protein